MAPFGESDNPSSSQFISQAGEECLEIDLHSGEVGWHGAFGGLKKREVFSVFSFKVCCLETLVSDGLETFWDVDFGERSDLRGAGFLCLRGEETGDSSLTDEDDFSDEEVGGGRVRSRNDRSLKVA